MLLPEPTPSSAESRQILLRRIELGEPQGIVDHHERMRPGDRQRPGRREHPLWILTACLLCETIMIPISGKPSDIYGRKPFLAINLILFACRSIAVSLCSEMEPFILCRAVQGLGGGILIPVATAAVGDIYEIGSRAKMMGVLGAVYGIGSGMGPLIGGFITEYTTWH